MTQIGRLIRGILLFAGVVLATGGVLLLIEEFWVWLKTNDWSPLDMQRVWDAMNVSSPPALKTIMESPLWLVMFTIGLIFIWVATELHESLAPSKRKNVRSCDGTPPAAWRIANRRFSLAQKERDRAPKPVPSNACTAFTP
jgi:hypothetical protein